MQEMLLYEYAIVRVMPRVERGEFINVGIIMYCKEQNFLGCQISLSVEKLLCVDIGANVTWIEKNLEAFEMIALGKSCPSIISKQSPGERFRWLSANRSTMIQCSAIHPGYTLDPQKEVSSLLEKLVK